ncbi:MAG: tyrosine-type recombinase/integrase, partial [Eggerthellaceae bacterium]|nr:tyrosine-type recombinase/integrase [Eggerthellaceae bacterium]
MPLCYRLRRMTALEGPLTNSKSSLSPTCLPTTTPVCCNEREEWVNLANFERWWRTFRTQAGFPELRFHELRHSQATLLLANGTDLKTVQDRMGYANGAITLNWYAHSVPENDAKAAQRVGDLYGSESEHEAAKKRKPA